ncbi:ARM repeat-containing protein [Piromyces finnis]|uniref:ARM repeat-containing protein n=1 Tax=Piromyces finnis TaxID=1754191 RepID=A0A1Y1VHI1_9FUNG|nr:ARM repeat-containing protein [Piromyces finnis]|eukprot:ORX55482.1 ARM repeat-containing protein [Piromyces finnis]
MSFIELSNNLLKEFNYDEQTILLKKLLLIPYPIPDIPQENVILLLRYGIKEFNVSNIENNIYFYKLISLLFSKRQLKFSTNHNIINEIIHYLLTNFGKNKKEQIENLKALSFVLYENGSFCEKYYETLINKLVCLANKNDLPGLEIKRLAIISLGNLCFKTGSKLDSSQYKTIYNTIYNHIINNQNNISLNQSKIINSSLRVYQIMISEDKEILAKSKNNLIYLYNFIFNDYKSIGKRDSNTKLNIYNSNNNSNMSISYIVQSDSEISDSDYYSNSRVKIDNYNKIKLNALYCLQAIIKSSPKLFYPYWDMFIPYVNNTKKSLLTLVQNDPVPQVRATAITTLTCMVDGAKPYLAVATDSHLKTNFLSLSERLGIQIDLLHNGLIHALKTENNISILNLIIKCIYILVQNSSYNKISTNYPVIIRDNMVPLIFHDDDKIKESALHCINILLDSQFDSRFLTKDLDIPKELLKSFENIIIFKEKNSYTIINTIISLIKKAESNIVKAESYSIISTIAKHDVEIIKENWNIIKELIDSGLNDNNELIKINTLKVLESYTQAINLNYDQWREIFTLDWWEDIISYFLTQINNDNAIIRATSCDCISNIPEIIFEQMNKLKQIPCITIPLNHSQNDRNFNVRAAACRTLGTLITYKFLSNDTMFIIDVASTIQDTIKDNNLIVRIRSSWLYGNFCDNLIFISDSQESVSILNEWFNNNMIKNLLESGISAAKDNDKCRASALRGLGGIVRICPKDFINSQINNIIKEVVLVTKKNAETGSVKIRWNSCHSICNMFKNKNFPIGKALWTSPLIMSLLKSIKNCRNFKVRINATNALIELKVKEQYGNNDLIKNTLECVLSSLENIDDLANTRYGEYKYQQQLKEKLYILLDIVMNIFSEISDENSEEIKSYNNRINNIKQSQEMEELISKNPAKFYEDFLDTHKDEYNK